MGEDRRLVHGYGCRPVSGCGGAFTDRCGARHRARNRHHKAQLRQPAMRRGRARSCGLQRPQSPASSEATDARARTATCHPRRSSFPLRSPGLASRRCWRSCPTTRTRTIRFPARGRRRLPYQRRKRERLLEPGGQRACSRYDAFAGERQARRPSHRSAVERNLRRSLARRDARAQRRHHRT